MSALRCPTNFVVASASLMGPAISCALIPSDLKYPIFVGTQRLKSSITWSVPRGEIQRTVCSLLSLPNALPAVSSEPRLSAAVVLPARSTNSRRVIWLSKSRSTFSSIPSSLRPRMSLGLPARPALADDVEDDVDRDSQARDDQQHSAEVVHPGEGREVDEPLTEAAGLARGDHLSADGRE